ncbi:MAG: phosphoribosylglycinamide formyltransferase, partial [Thermoplasmata archaeon]
MPPPLRVGVLASGEGTTFEGLARALASDRAVAEIVVLLSDRPSVRALEIARARDIPTVVVPRDGANERRWSDRVSAELAARRVDLVVLAGFLSILPPPWVDRWRGRAVNLHPSLLPRYGGRGMHGRRVHEAVLAAGEEESGVTVHLVTGTVDGGPPVAQERVPVCPGDTPVSLRERLRPVEVALLAATVRRFATGALPLPYPGGED